MVQSDLFKQPSSLSDLEKMKASRKEPKNLPAKKVSYAYLTVPKDTNSQNMLINEAIEWAYSNEVDDINLFPVMKKFSAYKFRKIADTNEYFSEGVEVINYLISTRLKKGWKTGEMESSYCKEMLPRYDQEYRDWICAKVTMAIQARNEGNRASSFNVILDPIQTSDIVPERKKEDIERSSGNANKTE
jgi:hypothetical protein